MSENDTRQFKAFLNRKCDGNSPLSHPFRQGQRTISYVTPDILEKLKNSRTILENGVTKMFVEPKVEDVIERGIDLVVLPSSNDDTGKLMIDGKMEKLKTWNAKQDVELEYKVGTKSKRKRKFPSSFVEQNNSYPKRVYEKTHASRTTGENTFNVELLGRPKTMNPEVNLVDITSSSKYISTDEKKDQKPRATSRHSNDSNLFPKSQNVKGSLLVNTRVRSNPKSKRLLHNGSIFTHSPHTPQSPPRKVFYRASDKNVATVTDTTTKPHIIRLESDNTSVCSIHLSSHSSWDKLSLPDISMQTESKERYKSAPKNFAKKSQVTSTSSNMVSPKMRIVNSPRLSTFSNIICDNTSSEDHASREERTSDRFVTTTARSKVSNFEQLPESQSPRINNRISVTYTIRKNGDAPYKSQDKQTLREIYKQYTPRSKTVCLNNYSFHDFRMKSSKSENSDTTHHSQLSGNVERDNPISQIYTFRRHSSSSGQYHKFARSNQSIQQSPLQLVGKKKRT